MTKVAAGSLRMVFSRADADTVTGTPQWFGPTDTTRGLLSSSTVEFGECTARKGYGDGTSPELAPRNPIRPRDGVRKITMISISSTPQAMV